MAGLCEVHQRPRQKNGVCPSCYFRAWYERNRDDVVARAKRRKREHRGETLEHKRRWLRKRRLGIKGRYTSPYSDRDIFERDDGICYLCLRPIDLSVTDGGPEHPTIDHLVPFSRGGRDVAENVRVCHKGCNSHKGRKLLEELAA